jgi:Family of unknown function (DUF5686)
MLLPAVFANRAIAQETHTLPASRIVVVADSLTRKTLSFASAVFHDTRKGVIADVDGQLLLKAPFPDQALTISRIGYQSKRIKPSNLPDTVFLMPVAAALQEVVVKASDDSDPRADWIIRQAISHKPSNNPDNLASYTYTSYNKLIADFAAKGGTPGPSAKGSKKMSARDSADSFPLAINSDDSRPRHSFLIESVIDHAYKSPFLRQETVKAQKITGLKKGWLLGLATQLQYFSFYPDNFSLLGVQYFNPVSGKYRGDYVFHLVDSLQDENGGLTWIISFRPRRNKFGIELLKGELHIHENDFGIVNVIASPLTSNGMFNISFRQQYRQVKNRWFPAQLNTDIVMTPIQGNDSSSRSMNMVINARTYLQDIVLDSLRSGKRFGNYQYTIAPDADDQSPGYWDRHRAIKLDSLDLNTYHYMDSLVKNNPDLRKATFKTDVIGDLLNGQIPIGKVNLRIGQVVNYNRYEGLRLGAGFVTNSRFSKDWRVGAYAGYGFGDKSVKYGGLFELLSGHDKEVTYGIRYLQDIELIGSNSFKSAPLINFQSLLSKHADSLQKVEIYRTGWLGKVIQTRFFVDYQNRIFTQGYHFLDPVKQSIQYNGLHLAEAGAYFSTDFKQGLLKLGNLAINSLDNLHKSFLELEIKGGKALDAGASISYQKVEARYTQRWSLGRPGKISATLEGGKVWGDLPYGMLFSNLGSYDRFSVVIPATFQTMGWNEFVNDAYAALFLNYETGYLIQRHERYGLSLLFTQNTGIGALASPQLQVGIPANAMNHLYTEAGFGIHLRTTRRNYALMGFYRYGNYQLNKSSDNFSVRVVVQ